MNRISWRPWPTYIHIVVDVKNRLHCFTTHSLFLQSMFFYCLFAVFPIASVVVVMGLTQISNFRFNGLSIVFVQWIFFHFPIFPLFSLNLFLFFYWFVQIWTLNDFHCATLATMSPRKLLSCQQKMGKVKKKMAGNTNLFIELKVIEALIKVLDKQMRYAQHLPLLPSD